MALRLVQARIPESEFQLLHQRAKSEGKSMQSLIRQAIRAYLLADTVNPADPLFDLFPLLENGGRVHRTSEDHDEYLYKERQ